MRYRAAVGVGEEAHSRQRHWCPWSKSVNVETWGHVPDPIVMAHTFAELGKGTMARARDNRFKSGRNLGHTLYQSNSLFERDASFFTPPVSDRELSLFTRQARMTTLNLNHISYGKHGF